MKPNSQMATMTWGSGIAKLDAEPIRDVHAAKIASGIAIEQGKARHK